jgi:hypothetical protein
MNALFCTWGGDLSVGPGGDINIAPVQSEVEQRIIRRLLTNPGDYIWHISYGAGLGTYVGEPYLSGTIEGAILSQVQQETLVAQSPSPAVKCDAAASDAGSSISVNIQYRTSGSSSPNSVALTLGN